MSGQDQKNNSKRRRGRPSAAVHPRDLPRHLLIEVRRRVLSADREKLSNIFRGLRLDLHGVKQRTFYGWAADMRRRKCPPPPPAVKCSRALGRMAECHAIETTGKILSKRPLAYLAVFTGTLARQVLSMANGVSLDELVGAAARLTQSDDRGDPLRGTSAAGCRGAETLRRLHELETVKGASGGEGAT